MKFALLPTNPTLRRGVEEYIRILFGTLVFVDLGGMLLATVVFPFDTSVPAVVLFTPFLLFSIGGYANARQQYRWLSSTTQGVFGIIVFAGGITIVLGALGSTTTPVAGMYVLLIVICTVFASAQAGALAFTVSTTLLGILLLAERAGWSPYAPLYPAKRINADIGELPSQIFLVITFINGFGYVVATYVAQLLRKQREEVQAANRELRTLDEAKTRFLSIVSHDLRTPLTALKAFGEIIRDDDELGHSERRRYADIVTQEADRLHRLVTDLLDLDKMEARKMEWTLVVEDIQPTLKNAVAVFRGTAHDKGITLREDIADAIPPVYMDADRMSQLVANLLSNAIKFTPPEGTVTLSAALGDDRNTPCVRITVEDTGPGIAPEDLERIFDRFAQARIGKQEGAGTGLGLAIAKEIATAHNGWITVSSQVGERTTFTVAVPTAEATAPGART